MTDNDDNVEWRTTLKASDVPATERLDGSESKQEYYHRLAVANTLDWNGKWRREKRLTAKSERSLLHTISSTLELTDFQRERAWKYYQQLPDDYANGMENGMQVAMLVVCALSGERDGRDYHPVQVVRGTCSSDIEKLVNDIGIRGMKYAREWERIEGELDV